MQISLILSWRVAAIAVISMLFSLGASAASPDAARRVTPDERVQGLLEMTQIPDPRTAEFYERIAEILRALDNDLERLLDQVFIYVGNPPPEADTDMRTWVSLFVLTTAFANERRILLEGLGSRLESKDKNIRRFARDTMIAFLQNCIFTELHIADYVANNGEETAYPTLILLFERNAELGFRAMWERVRQDQHPHDLGAYKPIYTNAIRQVAAVEHVRRMPISPDPELSERARESLRALSASDLWWARAYAAGVMSWYSQLRDADAIKRLRGEEHPVVDALAKKISAR